MNLSEISRVKTLNKKDFIENYFKPQLPVVIEEGIKDWPAYSKWNLAYMAKIAGDKEVPLYDNRPVDYKESFNEPHAKMMMRDYVDLLKRKPTKYRIFLWNILKEVPQLKEDFAYPDFGLRLLKKLPMMFFGGKDSYTFMHKDIDLANIFHFHFEGNKQAILFHPDQTKFLYKVPHSLITREDMDVYNPDYSKWPALIKANGWTANLKHGNMLYIPEGYWHYIKYLSPGFSLSLRAIPRAPKNFATAIYNIFFMRYFDNFMRQIKGQKWIDNKNEKAIVNTHKELGII